MRDKIRFESGLLQGGESPPHATSYLASPGPGANALNDVGRRLFGQLPNEPHSSRWLLLLSGLVKIIQSCPVPTMKTCMIEEGVGEG